VRTPVLTASLAPQFLPAKSTASAVIAQNARAAIATAQKST